MVLYILLFKSWNFSIIFVLFLSNGHSPQIRQIGELLVRMCRGESHFSQKIGFGECGELGEYRKI
jgi:hypothetical protein